MVWVGSEVWCIMGVGEVEVREGERRRERERRESR